MKHNPDKEKWINEVLDSTKGMARAQPGAELYEKISSRLHNSREAMIIPFPVKRWAAAAILLVLLNAGAVAWFTFENDNKINTGATNPLAGEMQTESTYNY